MCLQSLREALRYDGEIRNDKHILSFSLYEIAMLQIGRNEVCLCMSIHVVDVHYMLYVH